MRVGLKSRNKMGQELLIHCVALSISQDMVCLVRAHHVPGSAIFATLRFLGQAIDLDKRLRFKGEGSTNDRQRHTDSLSAVIFIAPS
ncbi:MAG: hypothetical protein BA870_03575 [Desulfuromonadales bacterium C00003094]|nr:MAG: hypothetical protein BA870_03575 [Desulfuromonadales bacterium C00003094]OEU76523.1 MAG: hypothetical protein BA869_10060 [Desulfuromonadales bacterium C00003107]